MNLGHTYAYVSGNIFNLAYSLNMKPSKIHIEAWSRFIARSTDFLLFFPVYNNIFLYLSKHSSILILRDIFWLGSVETFAVYIFPACVFYILLESSLLATWGYTPGKWIFNIKIQNQKGKILDFITALKRTAMVITFGCILFIKWFNMLGALLAYFALVKRKQTYWDESLKTILKLQKSNKIHTVLISLAVVLFTLNYIVTNKLRNSPIFTTSPYFTAGFKKTVDIIYPLLYEQYFSLGIRHSQNDWHKDLKVAFKFFYAAAVNNHRDAQAMLAAAYQNGQGVTKNYVEAYKWFYIALNNRNYYPGDPISNSMLENGLHDLQHMMSREQVSAAKVLANLYQK